MKCCDRIGQRTTYYTRGRKVSLCSKCLEAMLYAENPRAHICEPDEDHILCLDCGEELSRLASYYTP